MKNEVGFVTPEMETEVATAERSAVLGFEMDIATDIVSRSTSYCSFEAKTAEGKAMLYKAMNSPDIKLSSMINKRFKIKDIFAEVIVIKDEETGEGTACPRIVLIDDKGVSYQSVATTVYSSVKKIMQVFGTPDTWEKPLEFEVIQIDKGNKRMFSLNYVPTVTAKK